MNPIPRIRRDGVYALSRVSEFLLPRDMLARIREERPWREWIEELSPDLLDDLGSASAEAKRELFRRHVKLMEIETHAMCNRVCSFCPNEDGNRLRNATRTDPAMLVRLFDELAGID